VTPESLPTVVEPLEGRKNHKQFQLCMSSSEWRATSVKIGHAKPPCGLRWGRCRLLGPIVDDLGGMRKVRILEESGRPEPLLPTEIPKLDLPRSGDKVRAGMREFDPSRPSQPVTRSKVVVIFLR
jgi:hypothetical protein